MIQKDLLKQVKNAVQEIEVEWETGEVISSIIRNKKEWNSRPYRSMPIHKVIEREGIAL
jgi:hypothetical protein